MCGIAGFIDPNTSPEVRADAVGRMCATMVHRGPDDEGIESSGPATLGMRRLAIFDPAHGHQPMQSPDGRYTLVFNGAIYNFRALRAELSGAHWSFRTDCDTEVLLAAFARWGADCLKRLRGMFAFAVWDRNEQSLFLARDAFGIKPLYYRHDGSRLVFASELNALIASQVTEPQIDSDSVAEYLGWLAVPAPRTIYRNVFTLRPSEYAVFHSETLTVRAAWNFHGIPEIASRCRTRVAFVGELRERLEDSVRAHVIADVPVGAFLSGGLDSAAVVGLMTRASGKQLRTFSVDFAEPGFSERTPAEATARHYGTNHRTTVLTGAEVARDVEKLLHSFDQPTGDGINTYYASQAARAGGVTVALSGLGGDELFGGYPAFRDTPRITRWLPSWRALPPDVRAAFVRRLQRGDTRQRKFADTLAHACNIHEVSALQRRVFSSDAGRGILAREVSESQRENPPFHPALETLAGDLNGAKSFEVVSAWELRTYMADVLLRDSDTMSMRHSLELRVPLVDRPLIEWLWRQPAEFKTDSRHPKSALSDALHDILPPDMGRRAKWGFTLPMNLWMKGELRPFLDDTFSDRSVTRSGLFDALTVQASWRGFLEGNDAREWSRLWSLAMLIAFANRRPPVPAVMDRRAVPTVTSTPSSVNGSKPLAAAGRGQRRTLLFAPQIFAAEGGIPRILQTYLKALCELSEPDSSVRLVALNDNQVSAADIKRCATDRLTQWSVCGRNKPRFIREALRLSRDCNDLVCGHVFLLPVAWLAQRLNPKLRYHLVAHGIEVWRRFSLAERIALRRATTVLCVSDYTRRELLKNCPLPEGRAVVLPNALDPYFEIKPGRPLAECDPVILTVTRLTYADRYKGVQHLIEAMPEIRATVPNARLRIVGRGDDVPRLKALAAGLGMASAVEFTGFIDDEKLAIEMSNCRLFALPSRKEGFGLVFLEAMAQGRPCLGARAGGVPEVITETTGALVEYGNVGEIVRASIGALQRDWRQETILERARVFSYPCLKARLGTLLFT